LSDARIDPLLPECARANNQTFKLRAVLAPRAQWNQSQAPLLGESNERAWRRGNEQPRCPLCARNARPQKGLVRRAQPEAVPWGENQQSQSDHLDSSRRTESTIT